MTPRARHPPIWLLGFGLWPLGVNAALLLITMPQLLAAQHTPESRIAAITFMALAPGFVSFFMAPLLDWRFSRRTWAVVFTLLAGCGSAAAFLFVRRLEVLPVLFFLSNLGAYLVAAACGGWFGELVARDRQGVLGAWFAAVNIASGGLAAALAMPIFRGLPEPLGALVLGGLNLLVLPLFLTTPCPPADARLAREGVVAFAKDVIRLAGRPIVLWTLLLFVSPATAFALTNSLSGFAGDFHTSEAMAGLIAGAGVSVAGVVGSLLAPRLGAGLPPRILYIVLGLLGAGFSFLPDRPTKDSGSVRRGDAGREHLPGGGVRRFQRDLAEFARRRQPARRHAVRAALRRERDPPQLHAAHRRRGVRRPRPQRRAVRRRGRASRFASLCWRSSLRTFRTAVARADAAVSATAVW